MPSPAYIASAVNAEASSLWERVVGYVTGRKDEYARLENGLATAATATTTATTTTAGRVQDEARASVNTASAQFAHTSVEVWFSLSYGLFFFLNFFVFSFLGHGVVLSYLC